jgi:hypothetical protein
MGWVAGIEEEVEEVHTEVVFILWNEDASLHLLPVAEYLVICVRVFNLRYCAPNLTLGQAPLCSLILSWLNAIGQKDISFSLVGNH